MLLYSVIPEHPTCLSKQIEFVGTRGSRHVHPSGGSGVRAWILNSRRRTCKQNSYPNPRPCSPTLLPGTPSFRSSPKLQHPTQNLHATLGMEASANGNAIPMAAKTVFPESPFLRRFDPHFTFTMSHPTSRALTARSEDSPETLSGCGGALSWDPI